MKKLPRLSTSWQYTFILSLLASYFYVAMEWLFFATKPSFMDASNNVQKVGILFTTAIIVALVSIIPVLVCFTIDYLLLLFRSKSSKYLLYAAVVFPALTITFTALLLIDNFTYTVFKFGIVSTSGVWRAVYILVVIGLFAYFYKWSLGFTGLARRPQMGLKFLYITSSILVIISLIFVFRQSSALLPVGTATTVSKSGGRNLPNILIIGSDGINASNMSLYGYERETTPYLEKIAGRALVAENAFSNAGNSSGSVTSMLTSKLPTQTRVLFTPNVLRGADAYQHLPGILRSLGYYTAEIGQEKYVDSYQVNMLNGFNQVNGRSSLEESRLFRFGRRYGLGDSFFFLDQTFERLSDRLLHVFFIRQMTNPYDLVTEIDQPFVVKDEEKIRQILRLFRDSDKPLFLHVHLMGTHGPKFSPKKQVFSAGEEQNTFWMNDYYDDAILGFDGHMERIFRTLQKSGQLDNTIVVVYTDHNKKWYTTQRIPLVFFFPEGEHAGRIRNNVQNLDIAPTLLDYLGLPIPVWMEGQSLLQGEPPSDRMIVSSVATGENSKKLKPPFYQFTVISTVVCNRWYEFRTSGVFMTGTVTGHTNPCPEGTSSAEGIKSKLVDYLQRMDFDVKELPENTIEALPFNSFNRAQAAMFILKAAEGPSHTPVPAKGMFADVSASDPYAPWIEELVSKGLGVGCSTSPRKYCPDEVVTRAEAAKLILIAKEGSSYTPPAPEGFFKDVAISSSYASWIEELHRRDAAMQCAIAPPGYCPDENMDIERFLKMLEKTFNPS